MSVLMTLLTIVLMYTFYYLSLPTLLLSFLQVYLCRRNLRWGRILPIVSAVFGVLAALAVGLLIGLNSLPTLGPGYRPAGFSRSGNVQYPHIGVLPHLPLSEAPAGAGEPGPHED